MPMNFPFEEWTEELSPIVSWKSFGSSLGTVITLIACFVIGVWIKCSIIKYVNKYAPSRPINHHFIHDQVGIA